MRIIVVMLVYLTTVISCLAYTLFVDTNGMGDFATIQAAINAALTGDCIIVHPGKYAVFTVNKPALKQYEALSRKIRQLSPRR